jgi:hypothetical protein
MVQTNSRAPCESAAQRAYERPAYNKLTDKSQQRNQFARRVRKLEFNEAKRRVPMIDPRLVFFERAAARLLLIEASEMSLDDALNGLMRAILEIADCRCHREVLESFDRCRPSPRSPA